MYTLDENARDGAHLANKAAANGRGSEPRNHYVSLLAMPRPNNWCENHFKSPDIPSWALFTGRPVSCPVLNLEAMA